MKRSLIILILCATLGAASFLILYTYNLYTTERAAFIRERGIQFSIAASFWRYGVIVDTNIPARAIVVRMKDSSATKDVLIYTGSSTIIARQELTGGNGLYTGLTAPTAASFADLAPGTRVALLFENRLRENFFFARIVLLGNPL